MRACTKAFKPRVRWSMTVATASKTPRIGARGSPVGARQNSLFTGCGCLLGLGDTGAESRVLALLGRSPLLPLYLMKAATASRGLFPILIARLCISDWDHTWTARTTEQSDTKLQVISRSLFGHDPAYWLESGSDLRRKHGKCRIVTGSLA